MATILLADDSPTEIEIIRNALEGEGYNLITASDGEETEKVFFGSKPDLLILDVIMPKKDGYQVCRNIRAHREFSSVPIIMISSRNRESDVYWGLKQGADSYLGKPFSAGELVARVKKHLG